MTSLRTYLFKFEERDTSGIHRNRELEVSCRSASYNWLTTPFFEEVTVRAALLHSQERANPSSPHTGNTLTHGALLKELQQAVFINDVRCCLMSGLWWFSPIRITKTSLKRTKLIPHSLLKISWWMQHHSRHIWIICRIHRLFLFHTWAGSRRVVL